MRGYYCAVLTRLKSMKLLAESTISEDEPSKIKGDFVGYACSDEEKVKLG